MSTSELACTYAALILHDDDVPVTVRAMEDNDGTGMGDRAKFPPNPGGKNPTSRKEEGNVHERREAKGNDGMRTMEKTSKPSEVDGNEEKRFIAVRSKHRRAWTAKRWTTGYNASRCVSSTRGPNRW